MRDNQCQSGSDAESTRKRLYFAYQQELWAGRQENFRKLDQALLTLSSGTLVLSLTFITDVVQASEAILLEVLVLSWLSFIASIVCTLSSFMSSIKAYDLQLKHAQDYYLDHQEEALERPNPQSQITIRLNWVAVVSFVLGLLATLAFVTANLTAGDTIENVKSPNNSTTVRSVGNASTPAAMARVPSEGRGSVPAQMTKVPAKQGTAQGSSSSTSGGQTKHGE